MVFMCSLRCAVHIVRGNDFSPVHSSPSYLNIELLCIYVMSFALIWITPKSPQLLQGVSLFPAYVVGPR